MKREHVTDNVIVVIVVPVVVFIDILLMLDF